MIRMCSRCKKRPAVVFLSDGTDGNPVGLCMTCAKESGIKPINNLLEKMNISDEDIEEMSKQLMEVMNISDADSILNPDDFEDDGDSFEAGGAATFPFLQKMFGADAPEEAEGETAAKEDKSGRKKESKKGRKFLETYCINLTAKAARGEVDVIIGREDELYRTIQILSRRQKNNPCLIGEPGVGKTAIVEGLALKIIEKKVPARLMDKEIYMLDLTALVAGTQFRGQFESRLKGLVDEVKKAGNIILFIDEIHNIVGTGDAEGSMNAGNILKPALSRGEIKVIGATTFNEYRKYIEKDAALERRFQPVIIEEPSVAQAISILSGVRGYYEGYHNVKISDEIIEKSVYLSERYVNDRFLPDKAIDLLDEACACAALRNRAVDDLYLLDKELSALNEEMAELEQETEQPDYEQIANVKSQLAKKESDAAGLRKKIKTNHVTDDDIAKVIELWTGIPAAKVRESDAKRLNSLETELKKKIIGQDKAVSLVAAAVRRSRMQISSRRRPASFIFVGPTGVGKTELVKVLAQQLFDTPETLIRLDMSEFMEKHSVSRIIGAPPGYVGYDEAGQLTEKVRRKPYSVVLFDEIEKAHPDVLNILLQILDEGRVTDAQGRNVNFENTVIVMTSNAGNDSFGKLMGFGKTEDEANEDKMLKALEGFLRPEFIGRVDEVVVFRQLSEEDFIRIAKLVIDELVPVLKEKGIELDCAKSVYKYVGKKAFGGKRGARDLRRIVRAEIEDRIVDELIRREGKKIAKISLEAGENISVIVE